MKWLPKEEPCNVPSYAHTLVGVGGMVVTEDNKVLVVEERFATAAHWKLPGGYVDPGEGLAEAAIREVSFYLLQYNLFHETYFQIREETGIETEFRSIVAFRHGHNFNFVAAFHSPAALV